MLTTILLGLITVLISMSVQIAAFVYMIQYLFKFISRISEDSVTNQKVTYVISTIMSMLFIAHIVQVAVWAILFLAVGEFSDFWTAFYHSMVNFSSLGYGDIVMSARWRLLGAIEASTGVLMFGLSAGLMLSVMTHLLKYHTRVREQLAEFKKHRHDAK